VKTCTAKVVKAQEHITKKPAAELTKSFSNALLRALAGLLSSAFRVLHLPRLDPCS
jgi:hypothetical protein